MSQSFEIDPTEKASRMWGLLLHLSVFAGYMIPFAGLVVPILIWQLKKSEYPVIDQHGRNLMNWLISLLIYGVACFFLSFLLIGVPLAIALGLASVVLPIIAAIKANDGQVWKYPLAIQFF